MRLLVLVAAVLTGIGSNTLCGVAQDASTAAARAERQDAEERYNRLNGAVDDLLKANADLRRRVTELSEEVARLRAESARANSSASNYASQSDVQSLKRSLQELDEKRQADRKFILEEVQKLLKNLPTAPVRSTPQHTKKEKKDTETAEAKPEKGYEYEIQERDTLSTIVTEYQKKGVKVTMAAVIKANPKVIKDPNRLPVGKKIFIPDPSLKD
jgi:predicted nuclease with TOPRIM domain